MSDKIGAYLQQRLRAKKIKDEEAAGFLNIAASTLRKKYSLEDLYINEIINLSKLLDEDIILDYYYSKEPLKTLRDRQVKIWDSKINELKAENERQAEKVIQLNDHINTQKELIASLKREIEVLKKK